MYMYYEYWCFKYIGFEKNETATMFFIKKTFSSFEECTSGEYRYLYP